MDRQQSMARRKKPNRESVGLTEDELALAVAQASEVKADVVPPGWYSGTQIRAEIERQYGYKGGTGANQNIFQAVIAGKEVRKFRVPTTARSAYSTPHYKLK